MKNKDIDLLYEVGCLRFIQRTWRQFLNPDVQNVAEHTLRVIFISLVLAKNEGISNTDKIIKMALIHDLAESRTGDVNYLSRQFTKRNNEGALCETLQETSLEELIELGKEYEKHESIESKIVKDADILDGDFELQEQVAMGHTLPNNQRKLRDEVLNKLHTQSAKKLWKSLQTSNPHNWHLVNGSNRFLAGDWKK